MNAIAMKVLGWVLPMVLGPIVYVVSRELLNLSQRVDDLPPFFKRCVVIAISVIVSAVFGALKLTAPAECINISDAVGAAQACAVALSAKVPLQGVVAALVAFAIHAVKKQKPND